MWWCSLVFPLRWLSSSISKAKYECLKARNVTRSAGGRCSLAFSVVDDVSVSGESYSNHKWLALRDLECRGQAYERQVGWWTRQERMKGGCGGGGVVCGEVMLTGTGRQTDRKTMAKQAFTWWQNRQTMARQADIQENNGRTDGHADNGRTSGQTGRQWQNRQTDMQIMAEQADRTRRQ